jgi:hypothetical protein
MYISVDVVVDEELGENDGTRLDETSVEKW